MTLPASTYVVLGLLAKKPGSSGYDTAAFADRSVRFFWPISRSQLYNELSRLEELGWITGTAVHQDRYPDKRVYEPTPAGLAALRTWLDESRPRQGTGLRIQDVVLKTFLGAFMSEHQLADQVHDYRQQAEKRHAELSAVIDRFDAKDELTHGQKLARSTARYGMLQAEATITWTKEVEEVLAQPSDDPV